MEHSNLPARREDVTLLVPYARPYEPTGGDSDAAFVFMCDKNLI